MSDYPWFRLYNETLNDPKLKRIATVTKQPKALINGVWAGLLCLASESPERGKLLISEDMPYLLEEIIEAVGVDFELGELIIDYLTRLNLVSVEDNVYLITQWEQRQPKSDSSTERVRRYRQRQAAKKDKGADDLNGDGDDYYPKRDSNVSRNVTETESNVIESDKESDKETEGEKEPAHTRNPSPSNDQDHERQQLCRGAMLEVCYGVKVDKATNDQQRNVYNAFEELERLWQPNPDEIKGFASYFWGDGRPSPRVLVNDWSNYKNPPPPKPKEPEYSHAEEPTMYRPVGDQPDKETLKAALARMNAENEASIKPVEGGINYEALDKMKQITEQRRIRAQ